MYGTSCLRSPIGLSEVYDDVKTTFRAARPTHIHYFQTTMMPSDENEAETKKESRDKKDNRITQLVN